jgi:hypothetical protein
MCSRRILNPAEHADGDYGRVITDRALCPRDDTSPYIL